MKTILTTLLALSALTAGAQDFLKDTCASFGDRYLPGVGLVLFDSRTNENWAPTKVVGVSRLGIGANPRPMTYSALNKTMSDVKTWDRTLITLRVQDTLSKTGKDAGSASFSYVTGDREEMNLKGAAILDFYLPSGLPFGGYQTGDHGHGLHFRLGAQIDRAYRAEPGMGVDHREYFIGMNFLGLGLDDEGLKAAAASEFDFGYHIKRNGVTGESSGSWILEFKPAFRKIFGSDFLVGTPFAELFGKKDDVGLMKGPVASLAEGQTTESEDFEGSQYYLVGKDRFSIQPRFELEKFASHALGRDDGFCGCAGLDFRYVALGDQLVFSYSVDLSHSFDEGQSHVFHRASLDYKLKTQIEDFSINVSYINGNRAPDFVDEELFSVGFGLQF